MILVTGATGFIGRALVARLASERQGFVRAATRRDAPTPEGAEQFRVGDIGPETVWTDALRGVEVVVHTAARMDTMRETADPLGEFRRVNVAGSINLARQAAIAGVRRFVFLSSIKVNGNENLNGRPFTANDPPAPIDAYGQSKREAEDALRQLGAQAEMEIVIIRPVLVYGPGVRGNFQSMMRWLRKGFPLPLGAVHNKRSLVALDNLIDLIVTCVDHPAAANQTFLVSDGKDLSTTELLRRCAAALGKPARLIPVPPSLLRGAATLVGQGEVANRLFGSLQVDISKTRTALQWTPSANLDRVLEETGRLIPP